MLNKLSKLIARALGAPAASAGCKHPQPRQFAPAVEALEGRWVPATLQVHGLLAHSAETAKVSMQDFHFVSKQDKASPKLMADSAEAGKISMQDFHFVMKQDKASPKLMADSAEAGKVTMQDFHFVMKQDKASPKLMADSAEAGKVTMQDFHFVSKQDKASPKLFAQSAEAGINISFEDILVSSYQSKGSSE